MQGTSASLSGLHRHFWFDFWEQRFAAEAGFPAILFTLGGAADAAKPEVSVHFLIISHGF